MSAIDAIFYIVILVMSIVIHEVMHGFAAERFGDKTARFAGRLTLNPIPHIDLFGSILLPAILIFSHAPFLFGWAKPVPYNPDNLSNKKWGTIAVAAAGVLANLFIAVFFGIIIRLAVIYYPSFALPPAFFSIVSLIVIVNLALAIFNLVPIPPLDGSKILFSLLPGASYKVMQQIERYSFILLILFIVYFADYLYPILAYLFHAITSLTL
jgi:Zn-dependent protease